MKLTEITESCKIHYAWDVGTHASTPYGKERVDKLPFEFSGVIELPYSDFEVFHKDMINFMGPDFNNLELHTLHDEPLDHKRGTKFQRHPGIKKLVDTMATWCKFRPNEVNEFEFFDYRKSWGSDHFEVKVRMEFGIRGRSDARVHGYMQFKPYESRKEK